MPGRIVVDESVPRWARRINISQSAHQTLAQLAALCIASDRWEKSCWNYARAAGKIRIRSELQQR
jgi:hypothetical protein